MPDPLSRGERRQTALIVTSALLKPGRKLMSCFLTFFPPSRDG